MVFTNVSPDKLASATGYGFRGMQFSYRFPNLMRLLLRDRYLNLSRAILRNGWREDWWDLE
jgi:hypothetical protein